MVQMTWLTETLRQTGISQSIEIRCLTQRTLWTGSLSLAQKTSSIGSL